MKQKYFIIGVSNDEYELPKVIYENMDEMQLSLNVNRKRVYDLLCRKCVHKKTNTKYVKISLLDEVIENAN